MPEVNSSPADPSASSAGATPDAESQFVVVPSSNAFPAFRSSSSLTPLICDERAIAKLLETLIYRSGKTPAAIAAHLGITTNAVRQYLHGRRNRPSLLWFVRLAEICGAKVTIEFPRVRK